MVVDNRLEGPSNDRATVGAVERCTIDGLATVAPLESTDLPCISDGFRGDAAQTLERLLLVVAVVASGHVEELNRLILEQGIGPIGPCSSGRASGVHDDLVEGRLVVWLRADVLQVGADSMGTSRFSEYLENRHELELRQGRGTHSDPVGITAEQLDVLLDPLVRHLLVHQPDVQKPGSVCQRRRQETEGAKSVVDGDTDEILRGVADH